MSILDTIDHSTMTQEQIRDIYQQHWDNRRAQNEENLNWFKDRVRYLGYASVAHFRRQNPDIGVTAGTITNYFRGYSTMPIYKIAPLCYALKVTPDVLLTIMGLYQPSKQLIAGLDE
jgi:hypothetical protein